MCYWPKVDVKICFWSCTIIWHVNPSVEHLLPAKIYRKFHIYTSHFQLLVLVRQPGFERTLSNIMCWVCLSIFHLQIDICTCNRNSLSVLCVFCFFHTHSTTSFIPPLIVMNYVISQCAQQRILAAKPPEFRSVAPTHFPAYGRVGTDHWDKLHTSECNWSNNWKASFWYPRLTMCCLYFSLEELSTPLGLKKSLLHKDVSQHAII